MQLHNLPGVSPAPAANYRPCGRRAVRASFSEPAIWRGRWVFLATDGGTAAWVLNGGRLHAVWSNPKDGTFPVVAGNLLYVGGSG